MFFVFVVLLQAPDEVPILFSEDCVLPCSGFPSKEVDPACCEDPPPGDDGLGRRRLQIPVEEVVVVHDCYLWVDLQEDRKDVDVGGTLPDLVLLSHIYVSVLFSEGKNGHLSLSLALILTRGTCVLRS